MRITVEELRQLWNFLRTESANVISYTRVMEDEKNALKAENANLRCQIDHLKSEPKESNVTDPGPIGLDDKQPRVVSYPPRILMGIPIAELGTDLSSEPECYIVDEKTVSCSSDGGKRAPIGRVTPPKSDYERDLLESHRGCVWVTVNRFPTKGGV